MSPEYNRLFRENLLAFTKAIHNQEKEYTAFYPIIGKHYAQENHLLVVGQAVNEWLSPGFTIGDDASKLEEHIKLALEESRADGEECALNWVNTNWVESGLYRSFFWNVTYKLVKQKYQKTDENWNEVIAWSNFDENRSL
jgi:hypothetical protein